MHAEDVQILEIVRASLNDSEKISMLNALLDFIGPRALSLKVFSDLGYWSNSEKSLQGDIDWKLVSSSLSELPTAAVGNITDDVYDQDIVQIIKCDLMDSEKTSQLSALLPNMASNTKSSKIFIRLGHWNPEKQRFEGIPDWTAIIEAMHSQHPSPKRQTLRTLNLTKASDVNHESPAPCREGKADSSAVKRRRVSGTSAADSSSLPTCGEDDHWLRWLERVAHGPDKKLRLDMIG